MDLRLFDIFVAVFQTRSVSAAADRLGLAQPTVSVGLRKLRQVTGDSLFVRTTSGMEPTPRAQELFLPLQKALTIVDGALRRGSDFDPARSDRRFRLCISDSSLMVLLPQLLDHLKKAAPAVVLEVVPMTAETPRLLESGEADLAIGELPQLRAGFHQQRLFEQRYVCLVRRGHPRIQERMTARQYWDELHIEIAAAGADQFRSGRDANKRLKTSLRMPSFLGVSMLVRSTDLIATVPEKLGAALTMMSSSGIRLLKCPVPVKPLMVRQHWHARFHRDPQNQWLRRTFAELFIDPADPS